jgi:hypothetical protein
MAGETARIIFLWLAGSRRLVTAMHCSTRYGRVFPVVSRRSVAELLRDEWVAGAGGPLPSAAREADVLPMAWVGRKLLVCFGAGQVSKWTSTCWRRQVT